jgi:hypothetical protein
MDDCMDPEARPRTRAQVGTHDVQVLERSLILAVITAVGTSMFCLLGSNAHHVWASCAWKLHSALTQMQ